MTTAARPLGVSVVSILILLTGIGLLIRGILGLVRGGEGPAGIVVAILLLVVGLVYVLVAKGIWNGSGVARLVVTILSVIAIIGSVISLTDPAERLISIVQIVIAVVILALLYGRQARQFFG